MRLAYPVDLQEAADPATGEPGVRASFPDIPEAVAHTGSRETALARASLCLEEALAERIRRRVAIPPPSPPAGRPVITPGTFIASKAALYVALRDAGIRQADLARRMGIHPTIANRLVNPTHSNRLDVLDAALAAAGKRIVISLEDAP